MGDVRKDKLPFDEQWREYVETERQLIQADPRWWYEISILINRHTYRHWFINLLTEWEDEMARTRAPKQSADKRPQPASWTQFVTIAVSEADTPRIATAYPDSDAVYIDFERLLIGGYRVGFSYDAPRDAIICSVTCKSEGSPNYGKTFTAFAGDWYTALKVACFKHYHVAEETWDGGETTPSRPAFG